MKRVADNSTSARHCAGCLAKAVLKRPDPETTESRSESGLAISRQGFLKALTALAFLPLLRTAEAFADSPADNAMRVREIAPGVFVHHGRYEMQSPQNQGDMANASFVVGRDAVAVIDTSGSAICGADLRAAIRAVTTKPIRYVINTHMHPDHVFGNAAFREDSPIYVGHYKLPAALETRAQEYLAANRRMLGAKAFQGIEVIPPTLPVRRSFSLDLGGRTLLCEAERTAHTDNDLTITDSLTDTLFLGDLLFAVDIPTLDGSLRGWLALLHDFEKRKAARVVPGHGPDVMYLPAALKPEQRYLQTLADDVGRMIKDGVPLEQAVKTAGYSERNAWKLFDDYHKRNVTAAYAELEWE
jgi:quinoprotein relay system zinc metallohydrolase 2